MNFKDDAEYRKRLAIGFLNEAQQNFGFKQWRSCVDNSQLSIENSGKMIIVLFGPAEKTHNPSHQLKKLVYQNRLDAIFKSRIEEIVSILDKFGIEEHFMTDYGDETTLTDPWSLFGEDDANEALEMSEKCFTLAKQIYDHYQRL